MFVADRGLVSVSINLTCLDVIWKRFDFQWSDVFHPITVRVEATGIAIPKNITHNTKILQWQAIRLLAFVTC